MNKYIKSDPIKTDEELKNDAQLFEFDRVKNENLSPSQQDAFQDRLYRIIEYAIGRHDWYDEQRHQFLQIGLALMAVGVSLGAILVNLGKEWYTSIYTLAFVILVVLSIFSSGLIQLYLYNNGIQKDYPYRKIADIRSWYFKYNFPSGLEDNLSKDPKIRYNQINEVKNNLEKFFNRILEKVKDKNNFIKEDLEQVFILMLLQRYRQQQVKSMSNYLFYSMLVVTVLLLLAFSAFIFLDVSNGNLTDKIPNGTNQNEAITSTDIGSMRHLDESIENGQRSLRNHSISTESLNKYLMSNATFNKTAIDGV